MTDLVKQHSLLAISLLFLFAGIVTVAGNVSVLSRARVRIDNTITYAEELRMLKARFAHYREAGTRLRDQSAPQASAIDALLRDHLPLSIPEQRSENRQVLAPGWTVRNLSIAFAEVPMGHIMSFVHAAESLRPPWRMTACDIRALSREPHGVQVKMTFSALEYSP